MTQNQILALRELFPEALVINGYGMTEVGGITGFNLQKDYQLIMKKPGSVGRPIPGLSYKVCCNSNINTTKLSISLRQLDSRYYSELPKISSRQRVMSFVLGSVVSC